MTTGREDPTQCGTCGSKEIRQDEDVLDTWFSSGLWPFSTLGWPDETPDLKYFYPTSYMETGYDILFFWVARMIMMGLEFTDEAPFHTVYLHGLIRDEHGRKMSKTYGNVIDPLIVMDDLGTDALRFTLLVGSSPGNDTSLSVKRVEANRNFANKIWNVGRFVINAIDGIGSQPPESNLQSRDSNFTLADSWIRARLQQLVRDVERLFQTFQYGEAGRQIYEFLWSDFADWYVEIAKEQLKSEEIKAQTVETLARVFDTALRLLHPFTPFVTEELWGHLRTAIRNSPLFTLAGDWPDALIVARWPEPRDPEGWEEDAIQSFSQIQEIVRSIRNTRAEKNVKPSKKLGVVFVDQNYASLYRNYLPMISTLSSTDPDQTFVYEAEYKPSDVVTSLVVGSTDIYLTGMEFSEEDKARLEKELKEAESQIQRLEKLLAGDFANKAPAHLVTKEREKLAGYQETAEKIRAQLK
jgi:valyl-tRNA synthetase